MSDRVYPWPRQKHDQDVDAGVSARVSLKLQQPLSLPGRLVNLPRKENVFSVGSGLFPGDCFFSYLCTKQLFGSSS